MGLLIDVEATRTTAQVMTALLSDPESARGQSTPRYLREARREARVIMKATLIVNPVSGTAPHRIF